MQISRYEKAAAVDEQTLEDPRTGAVLETAFVYRDNGTKGTDLYLSVKDSNTPPPDPYRG